MSKLIYGYSRVSTERQARQGTSLAAQETQIKNYAEYKLVPEGWTWAGMYTDSAHSGQKHLLQRPSGKALSLKLEPGDCVVFSRLDRGFRNLKDLLNTLDCWKERRVSVHLLDLNCDTNTPIGRLIVGVLGSVAEFEQAWRIERVRLVCNDLKAKGYYVVGGVPYGFKIVGPRGRRKLAIDNLQREMARKFIEWRQQGWDYPTIWRHCWKSGIRWGGKEIKLQRIQKWVKSELALQDQEKRGLRPRPLTGPGADPFSVAHIPAKDLTAAQRRALAQPKTA
jgi:putative DNA-invertase from lambdoid prophage Rac